MDVKTAFLNGYLNEEIYMKQLEGCVVVGQEHKVCKLKKSLYGLKQAPKQWYEKFNNSLLEFGFSINNSNTCVYSKMFENECVIMCLYVDDMLIFGTNLHAIKVTKKFLCSKFEMKDLGEADVILGIKIK
jgi:hypothetical protein